MILPSCPVLFISGCDRVGDPVVDADYYWHLGQGQAIILFDCRPSTTLLADQETDPKIIESLLLVDDVLRFAQTIGLETGSNYTCLFDTGGEPVSWNVSASPPDRFEPYRWEFPIVGSLPYKGFFEKRLAEIEGDSLSNQGLDVLLRPVIAYSTLGFFDDPIMSEMLAMSPERLVELLLHELTHGSIFIPGHPDFNESLATFIGRAGADQYFAIRYGDEHPGLTRTVAKRADRVRFRRFIGKVIASLDSLYGEGKPRKEVLSERETIFRNAQLRFKAVQDSFRILNYSAFLEWDVNNARLLSYRRYNTKLESLQKLHELNANRLDLTVAGLRECEKATSPWDCLDGLIEATSDTTILTQ